MEDEDSTFGVKPDRLDRLVFEAMAEPEDPGESPATASLGMLGEKVGGWIDRYKLLSVLGEGGMGIVYAAEQEEPVRRRVAVKVVKPGMDSARVIARFEAEHQALALMEHPHVAHVYDAGLTPSGRPYFVMEYVRGISITEHCDRYELTIEDRLRLFLRVCAAIQHAHQKGIIHRDLKPSNILVTIEDNAAVPKVIDFGVARATSQPLTKRTLYTEEGQLIGTPEYMSPEQAERTDQDIDTRTDIYSLGVVLYELMAGVLPFDSKTFREGGIDRICKVICEEDPKTPSTRLGETSVKDSTESARRRGTNAKMLRRRLHGDLDWITLKAMEKDRARRYGSAGELAADIHRHLNHEPVSAGPPRAAYRIKKFVRRNRAFVAGVSAVLIVLVAGVVVSTVFAIGQARARAEAQAVSDFLSGSVLGLFDPFKTGGEEITRRSLLDTVSENLDRRFTGPVLAEAEIHHTLGSAYWSIGAYAPAAQHLERALEVCRRQLGDGHRTTLAWMETLGWVYHFQSRFREEERLFQEALAGARREWGDEHEQTGHFMWSLASAYAIQSRYEEAEQLYERALEISRRERGAEDRHTIEVMCLMVWVYLFQGRYEKAGQLSAKVLEINLRLHGPNDWWTLTLQHQMAELNWNLGRYEDAERLLLEVLDTRRSVYGKEHADTLFTMADLGGLYGTLGQCEKAKSLLSEALTTAQRVLGDTHLITASCMRGLGTVYLSQERYEEAEPLLENALKTMSSLLGEDHPWTLDIISDFGVLRYKRQRYDEAESLLREALEARQRKLGDDHPACFESMHELAVLYIRQVRYEQAEPLLLEAYNGRKAQLGPEHPHTVDSLRELVCLYESWDKPAEAAKWRARLPEE